MRICNKCSKEWDDRFTFCPQCGSALEMVNEDAKVDAYAQALAKVNDIPFDKRNKKGWIAIAKAFPIIAQVIKDNFPGESFRYMVSPLELDSRASSEALPMHFLFYKNGQPKTAVIISTTDGFKTPDVVKTRNFCISKGIKYLRVYADGFWADWIVGQDYHTRKPVTAKTVQFCKERLISRINESLDGKTIKEESGEPDLFKDLKKALENNVSLHKKNPGMRVLTKIFCEGKIGGYNIVNTSDGFLYVLLYLGYGNNSRNKVLMNFKGSEYYSHFNCYPTPRALDVIYSATFHPRRLKRATQILGNVLLAIGYEPNDKVIYKTIIDNGEEPLHNVNDYNASSSHQWLVKWAMKHRILFAIIISIVCGIVVFLIAVILPL